MIYTVKQLSKLSGVSIRTLHFYHQVGLLKPASIGENGYRYYKEEQSLLLQQILFFRELGFQLKDIKQIITSDDFDKVQSLLLHKKALLDKISRAQQLIQTIDTTIQHLKEKTEMDTKNLYSGFDKIKQVKYNEYLVNRYGDTAKELIATSKERIKNWQEGDFLKVREQHDELYKKFVKAIKNQCKPGSEEVQQLVQQHYELVNIFYTPSKEVYAGLGKTYCEYPDFAEYFASFDKSLAKFLARAIAYYAKHKL